MMSMLFGPDSETISSVSDRASALAVDQIAGAGTMAPAATPVTVFRKSRRFIGGSSAWGWRWNKLRKLRARASEGGAQREAIDFISLFNQLHGARVELPCCDCIQSCMFAQ